jgi:hypothetical protein
MNEMWTGVVSIATAIIGVAILAVIVSKNAQTGNVITAAGNALSTDIGAAVSPVTGGGGIGSNLMGGSSLSGGASSVMNY